MKKSQLGINWLFFCYRILVDVYESDSLTNVNPFILF